MKMLQILLTLIICAGFAVADEKKAMPYADGEIPKSAPKPGPKQGDPGIKDGAHRSGPTFKVGKLECLRCEKNRSVYVMTYDGTGGPSGHFVTTLNRTLCNHELAKRNLLPDYFAEKIKATANTKYDPISGVIIVIITIRPRTESEISPAI